MDRYRQASVAALLAPYVHCPPRGADPSTTDEGVRQQLLHELILRGASDYGDLEQIVRSQCPTVSKTEPPPRLSQLDQPADVANFFRELQEAEVRYRLGLQNDATATLFSNAYSMLPSTYTKYVDSSAAAKAGTALTERRVGEAIDSYVTAFRLLANGPDNVPPVPILPSNQK
jgi:hypothetical protein